MTRIIKRYSNRKLYDTRDSRYVSREDIAGMIRDGESVHITDKDEVENLTATVLAQIISEQGKTDSPMPASVLHDLIRFNQQTVDKGLEKIGSTLQKLGFFPDDEAEKLGKTCNSLSDQIDRLEESLNRIEKQVSQSTKT